MYNWRECSCISCLYLLQHFFFILEINVYLQLKENNMQGLIETQTQITNSLIFMFLIPFKYTSKIIKQIYENPLLSFGFKA